MKFLLFFIIPNTGMIKRYATIYIVTLFIFL